MSADNIFFEWLDLGLITSQITESGVAFGRNGQLLSRPFCCRRDKPKCQSVRQAKVYTKKKLGCE